MKVLHICTDYIYTGLYKELITRLEKKEGIENIVYVPSKVQVTKYQKRNESYSVYVSPVYNNFDRFFFRRKEEKILRDISEKINIQDMNLIHAHTLFTSGYVAYGLKKIYNIDYIVAVRSTDINIFFKYRKSLKNIGVEILQNASKIVFISKPYKEKLKKYLNASMKKIIDEKSIVIHNGIDDYWHQNRNLNTKMLDEKQIHLVQIGKLEKNKNWMTTIKVLKELNQKGYRTTLYLVGDGKDIGKIKEIKKTMTEQLICTGRLTKEEQSLVYKKTDIFILPSKHETFGLVYAEAITQSKPVIYTKNEGFDNFEQGMLGYGVQYNNVKEIIEKILLIRQDYGKFATNAYEESKRFDWDRIVQGYLEIYLQTKSEDMDK